MANLQVKNVPNVLHRKLRACAKRRGRTIREVVLDAVSREIAREAFHVRLAKRGSVNLRGRAGRVLEEVRADREREIGR